MEEKREVPRNFAWGKRSGAASCKVKATFACFTLRFQLHTATHITAIRAAGMQRLRWCRVQDAQGANFGFCWCLVTKTWAKRMNNRAPQAGAMRVRPDPARIILIGTGAD